MQIRLSVLLILMLRISLIDAESNIGIYIESQSYSNILPVKQLIEDQWLELPEKNASKGFTQNEMGLQFSIDNFYFGIAKRFDYFILTNSDTAEAFYIERQRQALISQKEYGLYLDLFHQHSNGLRAGYKLQFDQITAEIRLGYWQLKTTRESKLSGVVASDVNGEFIGNASFTEYYTEHNFLRRMNTDDWNTSDTGITVDLFFKYQIAKNFLITADLKDIYSDFTLSNSGYSEGEIETDGTFRNKIGGIGYLPLFRGKEITQDHHFRLPEHINITAAYTLDDILYLSKYKRQGNVNFYYLGAEIPHESFNTRILLDIENFAPEIQLINKWASISLGFENVDIDKNLQLNLSLSFNYQFN